MELSLCLFRNVQTVQKPACEMFSIHGPINFETSPSKYDVFCFNSKFIFKKKLNNFLNLAKHCRTDNIQCGAILKRPQLKSPRSSSTCMEYKKTQTVGVS